jgi:hypothetical protein
MKSRALLLLLGLGIGPAFSAEWLLIEPGLERSASVNPQSISANGAYRKAWFRFDFDKDQHVADDPSKGFRSVKNLYYFNCQDRTVSSVQTVLYAELLGKGVPVGSTSVGVAGAAFTEVMPGTLV